ncbi:putative basic helix-loop-helix dimerization region bhlh [Phaeomoniella chlamydospora]|uniref:Putative basic helix-loop-helix dimerization region bhlh n=1 Tax=Phaeomoniella chlamydospora TaxID=158046 RepID=A0A0G2E2A4_PHACM|nr:putative basic helix-loop-helix dimerization region bhlh [Phaeomoniella chlamydospora]
MTTTISAERPALRRDSSSMSGAGKKAVKKRVRNFTENDRAAHRVFEKGRREHFKEKLIELARLIPDLAETDSRRLSKHVVIDESIKRHKRLKSRCDTAVREIKALRQERDDLLKEVNIWRRGYGPPGTVSLQARPQDKAVSDLFAIEQESFGSFTEGFGDDTKADDEDGSPSDYHDIEAPIPQGAIGICSVSEFQ